MTHAARPLASWQRLAADALAAHGVADEHATRCARQLVRAEAMGRTSHGLRLVQAYVAHLGSGRMRAAGTPTVVVDRGTTRVLDAGMLPGPSVLERVVEEACDASAQHGVVTTVVRRSHHVACLGALAVTATRRGRMVLVAASGPASATVGAHGGIEPVLSANPLAIGLPGGACDVIADASTSMTSATTVHDHVARGIPLPRGVLRDVDGTVTDDGSALGRGGSMLLLGGVDDGHKGLALSLLVEALTQGLSGWGRADAHDVPASAVTVQVIDPAAFAGLDDFRRQLGHTTDAIASSTAVDPARPPRVPGARAMAALGHAERAGLAVEADVARSLHDLAGR